MKCMILRIALGCSIVFSAVHIQAQSVIKIVNNYVLIDSDKGLGAPGDHLEVYRVEGGLPAVIAHVRIVRFHQGRTAAMVLSVEMGRQIQLGDRIALSDEKLNDLVKGSPVKKGGAAGAGASSSQKPSPLPIERLGLGVGVWVPGPELDVRQSAEFALTLRGTPLRWGRKALAAELTLPIFRTLSGTAFKRSQVDLDILIRLNMGRRLNYELGGGLALIRAAQEDASVLKPTFRMGMALDLKTPWGWPASLFSSFKIFKANRGWGAYVLGGVRVGLPVFR